MYLHRIPSARKDTITRNSLGAIGILVNPANWKGWVAIATTHPRLQNVFSTTLWAQDWSMALLTLPGARPAPDGIEFSDRQRRAVLVPWDAVGGQEVRP